MTYTELVAAIKGYLNRTDLDDVIPTFIVLTEARINRTIRCRRMEKVTTYQHDSQYEDLPSDFLEARNIQSNTQPLTVLNYVTPQYADQLISEELTGKPKFFTIVGNQIELVPFSEVEIRMTYYGAVPALTDDAPSNWLATNFPDIYLYGTLVQAAMYLKDDPTTWATLFDSAVEELRIDDERSQFHGTTPQVRGVTIG